MGVSTNAGQRDEMYKTLATYFNDKGEIMDFFTYCKQEDAPYTWQVIRNNLKNYTRMVKVLKEAYSDMLNSETKDNSAG